MKYYFFLDESGDHGLNYIDKNYPLFLLCGCLFNEKDFEQTVKSINDFKHKYFNTDKVILHSREIRRCEEAFQILFDLTLKENFYKDLNTLQENAKYTIIAAVIDKEKYIKEYGKGAKDPYSLSLSFIIERLIFCLDSLDTNSEVEVCVEERGRKEDTMLLSHYNSMLDLGTFYILNSRLHKKIRSFKFYNKRENNIGLQIADLSAYPLARHFLSPEVPNKAFEVIKDKLYRNKEGKREGWGFKVFP